MPMLTYVKSWVGKINYRMPNTKALADDITDYDCLDGGVGHYIFDHILNNKDVEF